MPPCSDAGLVQQTISTLQYLLLALGGLHIFLTLAAVIAIFIPGKEPEHTLRKLLVHCDRVIILIARVSRK